MIPQIFFEKLKNCVKNLESHTSHGVLQAIGYKEFIPVFIVEAVNILDEVQKEIL
jgi:tRNA A37 N6-isopentenylltransferase MiaA